MQWGLSDKTCVPIYARTPTQMQSIYSYILRYVYNVYMWMYVCKCRGVFQHQKWCLAVCRNWWMRKGNEKEINLSVLNACTLLLLLLLLLLPNLRLNHTNNNAIANSAPTRAIVAVTTTTTAFSLTAALVSDLVCLFQSSRHPFTRMQNAFNHFICYCVLCFIHSPSSSASASPTLSPFCVA